MKSSTLIGAMAVALLSVGCTSKDSDGNRSQRTNTDSLSSDMASSTGAATPATLGKPQVDPNSPASGRSRNPDENSSPPPASTDPK